MCDEQDWDAASDALIDDMVEGVFSIEQLWHEIPLWCIEERIARLFTKVMVKARTDAVDSFRRIVARQSSMVAQGLKTNLIDLNFLRSQEPLELQVLLAVYGRHAELPELFAEVDGELAVAGAFLDASTVQGWRPVVREGVRECVAFWRADPLPSRRRSSEVWRLRYAMLACLQHLHG
jgi:hypothetical protein